MSEIKVTDRRLFDKDGNPNEPGPAGPAEAPEAGPSPGPGGDPPLSLGDLPATLTTLVVGLATQALALMGESPLDEAEPQAPDLPAAKHTIDLLGALQKKTKGNLDPAEESLIENLLYDLRMKYVALKKGS